MFLKYFTYIDLVIDFSNLCFRINPYSMHFILQSTMIKTEYLSNENCNIIPVNT